MATFSVHLKIFFCITFFLGNVLLVKAQVNDDMQIGFAAPDLHSVDWVTNGPIDNLEKGKFYVVSFSATWCVPCRKEIPKINALYNDFKSNVEFAVVYIEGKTVDHGSSLEKVASFVSGKYDFGVSVGVDGSEQTTKAAWRVESIPKAFLVDRSGKIIWTGFPSDLGPVIKLVLGDKFNPIKKANDQRIIDDRVQYILNLRDRGEYNNAVPIIDSLITMTPKNSWLKYIKFRLLAGNNDKLAYQYIHSLLSDTVQIDWSTFIHAGFNLIDSGNRQFDIELTIVDKTLLESGGYFLPSLLFEKALIYWHACDYSKAVVFCDSAIRAADKLNGTNDSISREQISVYKSRYAIFKFMSNREKMGVKKAANSLKKYLLTFHIKVDDFMIESLVRSGFNDVDLILDLIDIGLKQTNVVTYRGYFMSRKGDIYDMMGNKMQAYEWYKRAMTEFQKQGGDAEYANINRYKMKSVFR